MRHLLPTAVVCGIARTVAADVSWTAPSGCPDRGTLEQAIESRLDAPLDPALLAVNVTVEIDGDRFIARVQVVDRADAPRIITSKDCGELKDAVALVIARLVVTVTAERPPRVERPAVTVEPSSWNGGLRVAGLFGTGSAPGVGVAAEIGGWVAWRSWTVGVSGSQWGERTAMLDGTMSGVDIGLRALSLRAGWRPEALPVRTWVVAQWGAIRGEGVGLDESRDGTARWSAVGVGAGWSFSITPRVAAIAASELEFVLDRARFTLDRGVQLYRTPPVAWHGSLALEVGWR